MRRLLAIFAVLGLLASPVAASAAQGACARAMASQSASDMGAMPGMDQAAGKLGHHHCCQAGRTGGAAKSCAQTCATTCAVAAALPSSQTSGVFVVTAASLAIGSSDPLHPHEPAGLKRPPRSIA